MKVPSNILTVDLPRSFLLQIEYLIENACKSYFLVCVSYDSHFVFVFRACRRSVQYSTSKKACCQGVMIIEMRFVLICVSVALSYLSIVISKGMQLISKQISNTVFFSPALHLHLSKHAKQHIKMLLMYQATFLDIFSFKCFTKTHQISLLKLT